MTTSRLRPFRWQRPVAGPLRLFVVAAVVGATATAQVQWTAETFIEHRVGHVMAYDAARQRVVLFGGAANGIAADTWEWDGKVWTQRFPRNAPAPRAYAAAAYDATRQRVVLFGGDDQTMQQIGDTWEWDGTDWLARSPATVPPVRASAGMTWDDRRHVVLMFGGRYGPAFLRDTWEWNGQDWTRRLPATSPPADGYWQRLAFDSSRGRAVLVGSPPTGVFEWDGTDWHDVSPLAGPPSGSWALGWDGNRARTTLVGWVGTGGSCDTWEWDGVAWLQRAPAVSPERRYVHALAWDSGRSRLVLFGGKIPWNGLNDTWEWDGSSWTEASSGTPSARTDAVMTFDAARERVVLFGGAGVPENRSETWEWDGAAWQRPRPAVSPPGRAYAAMAFDPRRGRTVLFGGVTDFQTWSHLDDTWEWDGRAWTRAVTVSAPSARREHAMAQDPVRGAVLLYGGIDSTGVSLPETWAWDGVVWQRLLPATVPDTSYGCRMAADPRRGRVVLFGRSRSGLPVTWEWDGSSWTQRFPSTSPTARQGFAFAYDSVRARVVLLGGWDGGQYLGDAWEWDGVDWRQRLPGTGPGALTAHAAAYDMARGQIVVFGGQTASSFSFGTWLYGPVDPAAFAGYGAGCAGSAGTPSLVPASPADLPWLGETFTLRLQNLPPGQPAFAVIGASRTAWLGLPLPLDLGPLGMPGCALRASVDLAVPVVNQGGAAQLSVSVPNARQLVGGRLYAQGIALDPAANRLGATVSDAGAGQIGAK